MDVYENLWIRACKKRNVSHYFLRRILSLRSGLSVKDVKPEEVTYFLVEIVQKYSLADLRKFFNKHNEFVAFNKFAEQLCPSKASVEKDYWLETAISFIRFATSDKFPDCRWPLRFRSK